MLLKVAIFYFYLQFSNAFSLNLEHDLVLTLEKALNYVRNTEEKFNLDGIYGIVLAEVHLKKILEKRSDFRFKDEIAKMHSIAVDIIENNVPFLPEPEEKYHYFKKYLLDGDRWRWDISFREGELRDRVNDKIPQVEDLKSFFVDYVRNAHFNETLSDSCFMELLKSGAEDNNCFISKQCSDFMLLDDNSYQPLYAISHRMLFLQAAKIMNCNLNSLAYTQKARNYCSYMLWEANINKILGFLGVLDDMLMEQITVCGSEGFGEFFDDAFLFEVLKSQKPVGCFSNRDTDISRRKKREFNLLAHGCNDHTTGLGISTVALSLRYYLRNVD